MIWGMLYLSHYRLRRDVYTVFKPNLKSHAIIATLKSSQALNIEAFFQIETFIAIPSLYNTNNVTCQGVSYTQK